MAEWETCGLRQCWQSHINTSATSAVTAAETAVRRKPAKYVTLSNMYALQPLMLETLGPMNASTVEFLSDLGRRISSYSGDEKAESFLFQRLSIALQRYNAVLLHESFIRTNIPNL